MNTQLTTDSLTERMALSLNWLVGDGFKYFKSLKHFRRSQTTGHSYIAINSVTHNRISYHVAFYLGVQLPEVETWIFETLGQARKLTHYDRTIWNYTVNIGPHSSNWTYPIRGTWNLEHIQDFEAIESEITTFVRELGVPFVTENSTPERIRRTLIDSPRHATNIWPYRQILAIDCLYGTPEILHKDIGILDKRYEKYGKHPRKEFDDFVALVHKRQEVEQGGGGNALELPSCPSTATSMSRATP